jgi:hypothetical protein
LINNTENKNPDSHAIAGAKPHKAQNAYKNNLGFANTDPAPPVGTAQPEHQLCL